MGCFILTMYKPLQAIFFRDLFDDCLPQIFDEIFTKNIYKPYFEGKKDLIVMDVGANIGLFTLYAYPYSKKIYAIEPASDHFETLTKFIEFNKLERVTTIKKAISNQNGQADFYHAYNTTMHCLNPFVKKFNDEFATAYNREHKETEIEKVETITLDSLFKEQNIEYVDFLKLDVEGEEAKILGHSSFELVVPKIKMMLVESHGWNESNTNILKASIIDRGFEVKMISESPVLFLATRI